MSYNTFDIGVMTASLSEFDQAAAASAANLKSNFDVQLAGISESFAQTATVTATEFDNRFIICKHNCFHTNNVYRNGFNASIAFWRSTCCC